MGWHPDKAEVTLASFLCLVCDGTEIRVFDIFREPLGKRLFGGAICFAALAFVVLDGRPQLLPLGLNIYKLLEINRQLDRTAPREPKLYPDERRKKASPDQKGTNVRCLQSQQRI